MLIGIEEKDSSLVYIVYKVCEGYMKFLRLARPQGMQSILCIKHSPEAVRNSQLPAALAMLLSARFHVSLLGM